MLLLGGFLLLEFFLFVKLRRSGQVRGVSVTTGAALAVSLAVAEAVGSALAVPGPALGSVAPGSGAPQPANRLTVVTIDADLRGRRGPKTMGYEESLSFRVAEGVEVTSVSCMQGSYADGCEIGPIVVSFSAPVRRRDAKRIGVSPGSRGFDTLATDRLYDYDSSKARDAYWSVLAWGDYAVGGHYEVTIDPSLRDKIGRAHV